MQKKSHLETIGGSSMGHLGQMPPPHLPIPPFITVATELSEIKLYITQQVAR